MLTEEAKQAIGSVVNELRTNVSHFTPRATQNKMIAEVANTLAGTHEQRLLAIEAPTGTGKTYAYLIPSIILAKQRDATLIISSSNISLQEQLERKDLPELMKHTALDVNVNLAKGRSRYVCIRDMVHLIESGGESNSLMQETLFSAPVDKSEISQVETLVMELETGKWNGEKDSLATPLSNEIWQKMSCNRFTCSAAKCEFYEDCVFFKARKRMHTADVVIANHDLILADIANGNSILPDITESFIIFDEAHHLPAKSLTHFDYECGLEHITNTLKQVDTIVKKVNAITEIDKVITTLEARDMVKEITRYIADTSLTWEDDTYIYPSGMISPELRVMGGNVLVSLHTIYNLFDDIATSWKDYLQTHAYTGADRALIDEAITHTVMHLSNMILCLENFTQSDSTQKQARWLRRSSETAKKQFYLHAAKINVANELEEMLFSKVKAAILTSATLSSLASFDRLNVQLGVDNETCRHVRLPSPFDMKRGNFIIANMQHSPKSMEHTSEVTEQILTRAKQNGTKGTLVLFASGAQMQAVYQEVAGLLPTIWLQGNHAKADILSKHCEAIDAGKSSVIFGLDSFAEGVDLPRDYLTLVIIAKLRFSVPNSPLEKTTNEYLTSIGKNPFMTASLPDASLKLIQAAGRLIRTADDSGDIVVLDNRLKTARWGSLLIESLPDYTIIFE